MVQKVLAVTHQTAKLTFPLWNMSSLIPIDRLPLHAHEDPLMHCAYVQRIELGAAVMRWIHSHVWCGVLGWSGSCTLTLGHEAL